MTKDVIARTLVVRRQEVLAKCVHIRGVKGNDVKLCSVFRVHTL